MLITLMCSNPTHPVLPHLEAWSRRHGSQHDVRLATRRDELEGGDLLLLVSCSVIITADIRSRYRHTLVVHASDLPAGRGWSPLVWQVLEGRPEIVVTLLEAADPVDTGAIWAQERLHLEGHELYDEINALLFAAELKLMDRAVAEFDVPTPCPQQGSPTYYRRRHPGDSRLDPELSLASQFDLLRVADPERYPCFFDFRGHRYIVRLEKVGSADVEADI